jgi:RNA polymerase sigma factor (sigma-70 family)
MPKPTRDEIQSLVRLQLAAQSESAEDREQIEEWAVRSIGKNIERGRFDRLVTNRQRPNPFTLADYVAIVVRCALAERPRILAFERNDANEWKKLSDFLEQRATRMLQRIDGNSTIDAHAKEFAQDACLIIFSNPYPCDVAFEAWTTRILKNHILARRTRSGDAMNRPYLLDSLDRPRRSEDHANTLGDLIPDPQSLASFDKIDDQVVLQSAIEKIRSRAQRQVIVGTYFDGLSDDQIAQQLKKTTQAIYNLRQRALLRLREILAQMEVKEPVSRKHQNK